MSDTIARLQDKLRNIEGAGNDYCGARATEALELLERLTATVEQQSGRIAEADLSLEAARQTELRLAQIIDDYRARYEAAETGRKLAMGSVKMLTEQVRGLQVQLAAYNSSGCEDADAMAIKYLDEREARERAERDREEALRSGTWRCFHCGESFANPNLAEAHFGNMPSVRPACVRIQDRGMLYELRSAEKTATAAEQSLARATEREEALQGRLEQAMKEMRGWRATSESVASAGMMLRGELEQLREPMVLDHCSRCGDNHSQHVPCPMMGEVGR